MARHPWLAIIWFHTTYLTLISSKLQHKCPTFVKKIALLFNNYGIFLLKSILLHLSKISFFLFSPLTRQFLYSLQSPVQVFTSFTKPNVTLAYISFTLCQTFMVHCLYCSFGIYMQFYIFISYIEHLWSHKLAWESKGYNLIYSAIH